MDRVAADIHLGTVENDFRGSSLEKLPELGVRHDYEGCKKNPGPIEARNLRSRGSIKEMSI